MRTSTTSPTLVSILVLVAASTFHSGPARAQGFECEVFAGTPTSAPLHLATADSTYLFLAIGDGDFCVRYDLATGSGTAFPTDPIFDLKIGEPSQAFEVDRAGNLYFISALDNLMRKCDSDLTILDTLFTAPTYSFSKVAFEPGGDLFLATQISGNPEFRVDRHTPDGTPVDMWTAAIPAGNIADIAADATNLYALIMAFSSPYIQVLTHGGTPVRQIGNAELEGNMTSLALDGDGFLYVVQRNVGTGSVAVFDTLGTHQYDLTCELADDHDPMAIDPWGRLYVGDDEADQVLRYTPIVPLDLDVAGPDMVASSGFEGGPFAPDSVLYVVTSSATTDTLGYSITTGATWLDLEVVDGPLEGTLAPGDTVRVRGVLDASTLPAGPYATTIDFEQTAPVPTDTVTVVKHWTLDVLPLPPLEVAPTDSLVAVGDSGGPFEPDSLTYVVSTASPVARDYSVSVSEPWLAVNGAPMITGSVSDTDPDTVVVHLTGAADTLPDGLYTDLVEVAPTSPPGAIITRLARLQVGSAPTTMITALVPPIGITTAMADGDPDTVLVLGTLLDSTLTVTFGSRPATVVGTSATEDSAWVVLPYQPPGEECATTDSLAVMVTVTALEGTDTRPFTYAIVRNRMPEQYGTVQAAINFAIPGVCVSIGEGTYRENLVVPAGLHGITITSRDVLRPGDTTIKGGDSFSPSEPCVRFEGNDETTVLTGLQLILGNTGLVIEGGSSPLVTHCFINNNFASGDGGGVRVEAGCSPTLRSNRIDINEAIGNGGGLWAVNASPVLIDNNFNLNTAASGGGLYLSRPDAIVLDGIRAFANVAEGSGGGVYLHSDDVVTLTAAQIVGNGCDGDGGGAYLSAGSTVDVSGSTIEGNESTNQGGGLYVAAPDGALELSGSDVRTNRTWFGGGGLRVGPGTDATLIGNTFASNGSDSLHGGGVYLPGGIDLFVRDNTIEDNEAPTCPSRGGGLYVGGFARGVIDSNRVHGNHGFMAGAVAFGRKAEILFARNIVAYNSIPSMVSDRDPARLARADDPRDSLSVAPGIFIDDAGIDLVHNDFHGNQGASRREQGSGIHGYRIGVFEPDWINNIVSENADGWGVHVEGANAGARVDYNLGFMNGSGDFSPTIEIPGRPPFASNLVGDPLFVDPGPVALDFRLLDLSSPAVDAGTGPDDPDATPPDIGVHYFDQLAAGVPPATGGTGSLRVVGVRPNPFRQAVRVVVASSTPAQVPVQVDIFDVSGRSLMSVERMMEPGLTELRWDGVDRRGVAVTSGIYFCRLRSGTWSHVDKLILVR